jgi:PAS domain S-box-containing protein
VVDPVQVVSSNDLALAVIEGMPDAVIVAASDGTIVFANTRVETLLGWSVEDLRGQPVERLVPAAMASGHVALRSGFAASPRTRTMGSGLELDALHVDGRLVPVEISLSPLDFGGGSLVIAAIRDAREARHLRRLIVEERNRAQAAVDGLPDGVLEFDLEAQSYVTVNPRFCEMVGRTRDEILVVSGTPPWWRSGDVETVTGLRDRVTEGQPVKYEMHLVHSSGESRLVMVTAGRLRRDGRSTLLGVFHDLTEERRAAHELERARATMAVLEDRDRIARDLHDGVIQRLFAAGLSLQSAVGRPDQSERVLKIVDSLDLAIREIRTTIFGLHGRSSLDEGFEREFRLLVAEVSRLLGHAPNLDVRGTYDNIPDSVRHELLVVTRELLTNVVKHANATWTRVELAVDGTQVGLTVEDDGVGVDPDVIRPGSGLRNIGARAEQLHGTFSVAARMPAGTSMTWVVPYESSSG